MVFTSGDAMKIHRVEKERFQQWRKDKYIEASIRQATKPGERDLWSREDLYGIEVFKRATERGIARKMAAKFYREMQILRKGMDKLSVLEAKFLVFMFEGEEVKGAYVTTTSLNFKDYMNLDDVYVINFEKLRAEIDTRAREQLKDYYADKI